MPGPLGEVREEVELLALEVQVDAAEPRLAGFHIDLQLAHGDDAVCVDICRPAQDRTDPCGEMFDRERLDDVVVGAGIEHPHDLLLVVACRGNQDRHLAQPPDHPQRIRPIDVRKPQIENDEIEVV